MEPECPICGSENPTDAHVNAHFEEPVQKEPVRKEEKKEEKRQKRPRSSDAANKEEEEYETEQVIVPGLSYEIIMERAANRNACRGKPEPIPHPRGIQRCRTAAMFIIYSRHNGWKGWADKPVFIPLDVARLLAQYIWSTRRAFEWQCGSDLMSFSWLCPPSSLSGPPYLVEAVLQVPVVSGKNILIAKCSCPSGCDLAQEDDYCKHVRDCLLSVEDTASSDPKTHRVNFSKQPRWSRSFRGRYRGRRPRDDYDYPDSDESGYGSAGWSD